MILFLLTVLLFPGFLEIGILSLGAFLSLSQKNKESNFLKPGKLVVVVPAHNEAFGIEKTIRSLQRMDDPFNDLKIVVIADHCTDNTAEICKSAGVTVWKRDDPLKKGKGAALCTAFQKLSNENILGVCVIDADTQVGKQLPSVIRKAFGRGTQALQFYYRVIPSKGNMSELRRLAFSCMNHVRALGREYWGLSSGIFGNGFAVTAETLQTVFYATDSIVEDLSYHHLLVEKGIKVRYCPEESVVSSMPESFNARRTQQARWEGGRFRVFIEIAPQLLKKVLQGKGRFIEPLLELLTFPLTYQLFAVLLIVTTPFGAVFFTIIFFHVALGGYFEKINPFSFNQLKIIGSYFFWKLRTLPQVFIGARKNQDWIRTERENF